MNQVLTPDRSFGRVLEFDEKNLLHLMKDVVPAQVAPKSKTWALFWKYIDQGPTGTCVGHGTKHCLGAAPIIQTTRTGSPTAKEIYRMACALDPWPQNDREEYDFGTSVRSAFDAMLKQGRVSRYVWAYDVNTLVNWTITQGPSVIGVNWYNSMLNTDLEGVIRIDSNAYIVGGHCVCILGWNQPMGAFKAINSWAQFGLRTPSGETNSRFWIPGEVMERLIHEGGEAVAPTEVKR